MANFYEVLGVHETASFDEIKRAFRLKAKESHPDYHQNDPEAEERFKLINEAYEVLKDPQKKADDGRWWPIEEIDANLGKGIFTPNFESEYRMIRSSLLALL